MEPDGYSDYYSRGTNGGERGGRVWGTGGEDGGEEEEKGREGDGGLRSGTTYILGAVSCLSLDSLNASNDLLLKKEKEMDDMA